MQCSLASCDTQCLQAAFECRHAALQHDIGRIANARVAVAFCLEIEERGTVFCAVELVRDGLINGYRGGFSRWIDVVAALHRNRFVAHGSDRKRLARGSRPTVHIKTVCCKQGEPQSIKPKGYAGGVCN